MTFTLPGQHVMNGYFNDKDLIEKVETTIGERNNVLVETLYRDYSDFDGVKFPAMITEKLGGELSLILIIKDVKAGN